jgi:MscS family membrane protein
MSATNKLLVYLRQLALSLLLLTYPIAWSQVSVPKQATQHPTQEEQQPEVPKDALGRATPRGAVIGFLTESQKGNAEIAALYLNTPLRGKDVEILAQQLAAVLNSRLPARLNEISDQPDGSLSDPRNPDRDIIGTIKTAKGDLDIAVERVDREKVGKVWLFSEKTLASIPEVFKELNTYALEDHLPDFLITTRLLDIPLFEWLAVFVGMPFVYFLIGLLDRVVSWFVSELRRQVLQTTDPRNRSILLRPIRLLLLALFIRWLSFKVQLPLLARQFWSSIALLLAVSGCVSLLVLLNGWGERYLVRRRRGLSGSASVLRLVRRVIDVLILFSAVLFVFYHFGINPTAALAGLGVGGIAIALAAQRTLENVIAGVSLVADQAVRVGDFLNAGEIQGTVEEIGLRSTRLRTLNRTVVSVPNSQIANMSLEIASARDKYWFHPLLTLRYETTVSQMKSVISGVRQLLTEHVSVERDSVRVRFISLAAHSMDVEIVAYLSAVDWNNFLEIQEELLLGILQAVEKAGTAIAFPSQTLYLEADSLEKSSQITPDYAVTRAASDHDQPQDLSLKKWLSSGGS